eukprot:2271903-Rhodomonas_salina.3
MVPAEHSSSPSSAHPTCISRTPHPAGTNNVVLKEDWGVQSPASLPCARYRPPSIKRTNVSSGYFASDAKSK